MPSVVHDLAWAVLDAAIILGFLAAGAVGLLLVTGGLPV